MSNSQTLVGQRSLSVAQVPADDSSFAALRSRRPLPIDALSGAWQARLATESTAVVREWIDQFRPGGHRRARTLI